MKNAKGYKSVEAAFEAAKRLAKRTGKKVTVVVPRATRTTMKIPAQSMREMVYGNPRPRGFGFRYASKKEGGKAVRYTVVKLPDGREVWLKGKVHLERARQLALQVQRSKNPRRGYPHALASKYIAQEFRAGRKGKQAVAIGIARARRGNPIDEALARRIESHAHYLMGRGEKMHKALTKAARHLLRKRVRSAIPGEGSLNYISAIAGPVRWGDR